MSNKWIPAFKESDLVSVQEELLYPGYCQVKRLSFQFPLFDGGVSHSITREVVSRPPAVAVVLYDPVQDKVVMIEQLRAGAIGQKQDESPWLLEIVAGLIDPHERPEETAKREALEEAGCTIHSLIPICHYLASPGILDEVTFVFCGKVTAPTPTQKRHHGLVEEGEDIKIHVFSTEEVFALLKAGRIQSASAVIGIQWLALNKASLRFPQ